MLSASLPFTAVCDSFERALHDQVSPLLGSFSRGEGNATLLAMGCEHRRPLLSRTMGLLLELGGPTIHLRLAQLKEKGLDDVLVDLLSDNEDDICTIDSSRIGKAISSLTQVELKSPEQLQQLSDLQATYLHTVMVATITGKRNPKRPTQPQDSAKTKDRRLLIVQLAATQGHSFHPPTAQGKRDRSVPRWLAALRQQIGSSRSESLHRSSALHRLLRRAFTAQERSLVLAHLSLEPQHFTESLDAAKFCALCQAQAGSPPHRPPSEQVGEQRRRLGPGVEAALLRRLWDRIHSGQCSLYGQRCTDLPSFFASVDRGESGSISRGELRAALRRLDVGMSTTQLDRLLSTVLLESDDGIEVRLDDLANWMGRRDMSMTTASAVSSDGTVAAVATTTTGPTGTPAMAGDGQRTMRPVRTCAAFARSTASGVADGGPAPVRTERSSSPRPEQHRKSAQQRLQRCASSSISPARGSGGAGALATAPYRRRRVPLKGAAPWSIAKPAGAVPPESRCVAVVASVTADGEGMGGSPASNVCNDEQQQQKQATTATKVAGLQVTTLYQRTPELLVHVRACVSE